MSLKFELEQEVVSLAEVKAGTTTVPAGTKGRVVNVLEQVSGVTAGQDGYHVLWENGLDSIFGGLTIGRLGPYVPVEIVKGVRHEFVKQIVSQEKSYEHRFGLSDFVSDLQRVMTSIPEEYRASAIVTFEQLEEDHGYGDVTESICKTIFYMRPETDDEVNRRAIVFASQEQLALERKKEQIETLRKEIGDD